MSEDQHQRNLLRYATVGMEFFLTFMIFLAAGFALDKLIFRVTFPGFSILGAIIGFAAGFYRITRQGWGILKWAQKEHEEEEKKRREQRKRKHDKT